MGGVRGTARGAEPRPCPARRFPDFKALSKSGNFTHAVDAVIITHFHLDHCGALPYFTEVAGYSGPIYMTYPTKAIVPVMLEDFHKVMVDRRGEAELFSRRHISDCMRKVPPFSLPALSSAPSAAPAAAARLPSSG